MFKYALILFLAIAGLDLNAGTGIAVLVKGKILESGTNRPIGTELIFVNSEGKRSRCRSNSKDGSYTQALNAGESYVLVLKDYVLDKEFARFDIEPTSKYEEIERDINVKKLFSGYVIDYLNVFGPNSAEADKDFMNSFRVVDAFQALNKLDRVKILVNMFDSKGGSGPKTAVDKSKKGKSGKSSTSPKIQTKDLIQRRIASLRALFDLGKIDYANDTFAEDSKPAKSSGKKSSVPANYDVKIVIK